MTPRRKRALVLAAVILLAVIGAAAYRDGRSGHRVAAERMTNHAQDFDFSQPPCSPAGRPDDDGVRIAYLGVGGLLIEWRGATLVSAPYYTHQGPFEALLGKIRVDADAIAREVAAFEPARWDTILSGHSHYDHFADVPELMLRHATAAELWTNPSGANMLAAFPDLEDRVNVIDNGKWVRPDGVDGRPLPYRFAPLASEHAPHVYGYRYAHGSVNEPWTTWDDRRVVAMRDGLTSVFLVDLLDEEDNVAFRIHFQDSAGPAEDAIPPEWIAEHQADLAVLCVPPHWHIDGFPENVLDATLAPFVLAVHYENFLQPLDRPLRFIRSMTDARLESFFDTVEAKTADRPAPATSSAVCGPAAERWAMPLPGEWIGFEVPETAVLTSSTP